MRTSSGGRDTTAASDPILDAPDRHAGVFENARVALWDQDFSAVLAGLDELRRDGVTDLRGHLEAHPELLARLMQAVRIVDVNSYAIELFEASRKEELLGGLGPVFLPETTAVFRDELEALWAGRRRFEGEATLRTLRGRRLDVLVTIHWGGESGERTLVSLIDISRQKITQRDSALLASIVAWSDDAIVSKDLNGIVTSWNRGAERLFGYSADEMVGSSITRIIPAEHLHEEAAILAQIRAGQLVDHYETIRRTKDGQLVDVSLTISPLRDGAGTIIGASKIARDISGSKRVRLALERYAREQAALFAFTDRLYRAEASADIFDAALDAITQSLRCDRASILLFDGAGVMRFVAWRGLSDGYRAAVDGHSPWTRESKDPDPLHIDDVEAADLEDELREAIRAEGIRALAFIPLLVRGEVIGKFMAYFREAHPVSRTELDLAVVIARQLGFAIERSRADEQRDLLLAELSHRVKNTLSTVLSIARQSLSGTKSLDEARGSFEARLRALSHTHTRLAEQKWSGASLEAMLLDELMPYSREDRANVHLKGPRIELNPQSALTLGMVIHELATNAAKHGALSTREGNVEITWRIVPRAEKLEISWTERGGPRVALPSRSGFGRLLLERALPSSLMGEVDLRFDEDGLKATLALPLAQCVLAGASR